VSPVRLLVLDCHGLVLNDPWRQFIRDCARRAGADEAVWLQRWRREWRQRAWLGQMSDGELWEALCGESRDRADWTGFLEPRYSLGPAAPHLARWRRRAGVVLLSNHRGAWLRPRLDRWQLTRCFDRILVSDEIAVVKPDRRAFEIAIGDVPAEAVLYADNAEANVNAARQAGLTAVLAASDAAWIAEIDARLG
jgi:putative hydrolase of the HAD superfamily